MIEQAIADHLRSDTTTLTGFRQTARERFRHLAGKLYLGRLPQEAPPIGVSVRSISGGEMYEVASELDLAQPLVEFMVYGRDHEHGLKVIEVADVLRRIFSSYRGTLGELFCNGCTLERSASLVPSQLADGSDRWAHQHALDFRFTVNKVIE